MTRCEGARGKGRGARPREDFGAAGKLTDTSVDRMGRACEEICQATKLDSKCVRRKARRQEGVQKNKGGAAGRARRPRGDACTKGRRVASGHETVQATTEPPDSSRRREDREGPSSRRGTNEAGARSRGQKAAAKAAPGPEKEKIFKGTLTDYKAS